jgi:hypothetical protein
MRKLNQQQNVKDNDKKGSWDWAIEQARERIRNMQAAIRVFEERKEAGDVWPGLVAADKIFQQPRNEKAGTAA